MDRTKILQNRQTFTSDTEDIKVVANNIERLNISLDYLEAGATAPTLAQIIALINEIKLTVGGEIVTLIKAEDLYALNYLWLDHRPFYLLPTADNEIGVLEALWLPVEVSTDKTVNVQLSYTGHTRVDTEKLTLEAEYRDKPYPRRPFSFKYITGTIATTEKEWDFDQAGKQLLGMLIYNTTIPLISALDYTIGELKLLLKRAEIFHRHALCMKGVTNWDVEDTAVGGILDNYHFLKFKEPIPADSIKLRAKSLASAVDAFRAIGIYR